MRFIKLSLLSIFFLFLLVTAISLFIPSRIRISKAIDIHTSRQIVVSSLRDPLQWKKWYPGADTMDLLSIDGQKKGIVLNRNSQQGLFIVPENDSTIAAIFTGALARKIKSGFNIIGAGEAVTVQWWMDFRLRWYPWEKFSSLFFENIYGAEMEKALINLKHLIESGRSSLN